MSIDSRALAHDRLAELVVELSGVRHKNARHAVDQRWPATATPETNS